MNHREYRKRLKFLESLHASRTDLGIMRDLSLFPDFFGKKLRVKGLYIWGRLFTKQSTMLSQMEFDVILYNETDKTKVIPPEGYLLFRIRDLQEFAYLAAIRPAEIEQ